MTTKSILPDPKVYAERCIGTFHGDAITAYRAFQAYCAGDRVAFSASWRDAVYDAFGCAGTDALRIAKYVDCSGGHARGIIGVLGSILVFASAAHAADLKVKGEQLAAEIELVCGTVAVFARAAGNAGRAFLNIGLKVSDAPWPLPVFQVLRAVRNHGGHFNMSAIQTSDTEDTLVIILHEPLNARMLHELASALNQEAIAQWSSRGGELRGPKAELWGEFDPSQFLLLDGRRLSAVIGG